MSTQRRCDIFRAVDNKWYMLLGKFEHAQEAEDCQAYGPFNTADEVEKELLNHSNPGGINFDPGRIRMAPKHPLNTSSNLHAGPLDQEIFGR